MLWLAICVGVLIGGIDLPWPARLILGLILVAANFPAIRVAVLLRGPRAVRRLEWDHEGRFRVGSKIGAESCPAILQPASFRLGIAFVVLWFATPAGLRVVLIDGGRQDPVAFRRLSRHLARGMLIPSGPKV
jgi:hypothetical protein